MSEPIKAGDLIQVVRSCCGVFVGHVWIVEKVGPLRANVLECNACNFSSNSPGLLAFNDHWQPGTAWVLPVAWLKRIPPLSELEVERRDETLKEPA